MFIDIHMDIYIYIPVYIYSMSLYIHTYIHTYIHMDINSIHSVYIYRYPHIWPLEDALKPDHFPRDILGGEQVTMPSNQSLTRNLNVFSH